MPMPIQVMIVDDNPDTLELLREKIDGWGYRVAASSRWLEALEIIRRSRPGVLLLDVMMPEIDGIEAARQLREVDNSEIPVVFVTALSRDDLNERAVEKAAEVLHKPFRNAELRSLLERIIGKPTGGGMNP